MLKCGNLNRRDFIRGTAVTVAVTTAGGASVGPGADASESGSGGCLAPLIASAPILQNAAETSIGVAFAVSADASGWVEYSTSADMMGAKRVYSGGHGLMRVDNKVALIRLTGLRPATRYFYRIGADRIDYRNGYEMRNLGAEADRKIHSFTTLGTALDGSFCVINDTHDEKESLGLTLSALAALKPSVVVWNGDASNTSECLDDALGVFVRTHDRFPEYASDTPYAFLPGNHDFRGRFNRRLEDLMMFREPAERAGEHAELGRNFVLRLGDIALIGLDTGEDKLDTNPIFAGIFMMKPYREKQAKWLSEIVETPAVRTAKFKVAFCHIPLFDARPDANPGDVAPDDKDPRYKTDYAVWQRTCAELWAPSFVKAGVQLVIAAHQHRFRYDAPTQDRPWAQIVGGGSELGYIERWSKSGRELIPDASRFPTVIEGRVRNDRLTVVVHNVMTGGVAGEYVFSPTGRGALT